LGKGKKQKRGLVRIPPEGSTKKIGGYGKKKKREGSIPYENDCAGGVGVRGEECPRRILGTILTKKQREKEIPPIRGQKSPKGEKKKITSLGR